MLNAKKCSNLAEREGFEPSVPVTQYARLAIWCLRPLGHLSASKRDAGELNNYALISSLATRAITAGARPQSAFCWAPTES